MSTRHFTLRLYIRLIYSYDDLTRPVNLGNPGEFTMIVLAKLILELTGSRAVLVHDALLQGDTKQRQADIGSGAARVGCKTPNAKESRSR